MHTDRHFFIHRDQSFTEINLFTEINSDTEPEPVSAHFLCSDSAEEFFSGVHQTRKYSVVFAGNVADFYAVRVFYQNCPFIVWIMRFTYKGDFVSGVEKGFQFFNAFHVCGSGNIGVEQKNFLFKRYRERLSVASVQKTNQSAAGRDFPQSAGSCANRRYFPQSAGRWFVQSAGR